MRLFYLLFGLLLPVVISAQDTTSCAQTADLDGDFLVGVGDILVVLGSYGEDLDLDGDMILDCVDDCVGAYDTCGVCNGPGPVYECGCSDVPAGYCDCEGNVLDAAGECGGTCTEDIDDDGICDDVDECIGTYDVVGVCNGSCTADADSDGICDDVDGCIGAFDECGICNGPGPQVLAIDTIIITYDSIYVDVIDEWLTYELLVDTLLHLVCENPGCTNPLADNFDPYAEEGGTCTYLSCEGPTFDGFTYSAVEIGDQCWFAENLRTTVYRNGDVIPAGLTDSEWTSTSSTSAGATAVLGEGSSGCYGESPDIDACDDVQSLAEYGRLYNWYAVEDARSLCPVGWHVPTDEEWTDLEDFITTQGFSGTEGTALKSTYGWNGGSNGTDDFGFSALPGGGRTSSNGNFFGGGFGGYWWSSLSSGGNAWYRYLSYGNSPDFPRDYTNPRVGFSVRCLRDAE